MNEWNRLSREAESIKKAYPAGTRVLLINMDDPFAPVPSGTRGTVKAVDDIGQIHMHWDNGRTLAIVPGEDSFRKLTPAEIAEERNNEREGIDQLIGDAERVGQHQSPVRDKNSVPNRDNR